MHVSEGEQEREYPDGRPLSEQPRWRQDFPTDTPADDALARRVVEFRYPDDHEPCLALCLAPGRYVAYGQKCSHLACAVVPHLDRNELHCPCHNGYFEAAGGRPIAGPPRRPLPLVTLEVTDGAVYAVGFEPRTV